jgi:hypothetical protein
MLICYTVFKESWLLASMSTALSWALMIARKASYWFYCAVANIGCFFIHPYIRSWIVGVTQMYCMVCVVIAIIECFFICLYIKCWIVENSQMNWMAHVNELEVWMVLVLQEPVLLLLKPMLCLVWVPLGLMVHLLKLAVRFSPKLPSGGSKSEEVSPLGSEHRLEMQRVYRMVKMQARLKRKRLMAVLMALSALPNALA